MSVAAGFSGVPSSRGGPAPQGRALAALRRVRVTVLLAIPPFHFGAAPRPLSQCWLARGPDSEAMSGEGTGEGASWIGERRRPGLRPRTSDPA